MPVVSSFISPPLGFSIPYLTPHAVSVSLPTWEDNVGYEEGEERVVSAMQTGYPRFFVHKSIQKLAALAEEHFGVAGREKCYLYPSSRIANRALDFLKARDAKIQPFVKEWTVQAAASSSTSTSAELETTTIYAVFTDPGAGFTTQKQYWQHTGDGISSRLADNILHSLGFDADSPAPSSEMKLSSSPSTSAGTSRGGGGFSRNKHYSKKSTAAMEAIMASAPIPSTSTNGSDGPANGARSSSSAANGEDTTTYIEERYARNLAASQAPLAKLAMRRRIAGVLRDRQNPSDGTASSFQPGEPSTQAARLASSDVNGTAKSGKDTHADDELQPSSRGVTGLTEDDVFLYPGGMSAIFHSFLTILHASASSSSASPTSRQPSLSPKAQGKRPVVGKSVCFGFPYTDTLKILEKWGPGCHFFGRGLDTDLPALEELLQSQLAKHETNPDSQDPEDQPVLALYCEFPSNPLLRAPNLDALKQLKEKYGFAIVIDETIGGFTNVETLPFADIVVSSLTKIFSGDSNVMGGSLTLNPSSPHYTSLKQALLETYEDTYYDADAIFMERNSRDFVSRVAKINRSTEVVCELLQSYSIESGRSLHGDTTSPAVTKVYYPKYITPHNYAARMRPASTSTGSHEPGFGGLFSVTFSTLAASRAFFNALKCCKGPSLGTNFTLACPYTVLAHYLELDWAAEWEVEEGLVRVSVGLEDEDTLVSWFSQAVHAAEAAR